MTDSKTPDLAAAFESALSDAQENAKTAYEKGLAAISEHAEFNKGNVQALTEAAEILAAGLKSLNDDLVAAFRASLADLSTAVGELAAAQSPEEFVKLQDAQARKLFEGLADFSKKHSEALTKLGADAASPVASRFDLAVKAFKKAA